MSKKILKCFAWTLGCVALLTVGNAAPASGDADKGKGVFENNCAECHSAYSKDEGIGPGLQGMKEGKMPNGRKATHDELLDVINTGPAEMPSFKDQLTAQEKEDLIAFLMKL